MCGKIEKLSDWNKNWCGSRYGPWRQKGKKTKKVKSKKKKKKKKTSQRKTHAPPPQKKEKKEEKSQSEDPCYRKGHV